MQSIFSIKPIPEIRFGAGCLADLPDMILARGSRVLLITGAESFTSTARWKDLALLFEQFDIRYILERISGEPSPQAVNRIVERHGAKDIDVVVAVGGGSVLDGGKAVSAMVPVWKGRLDETIDIDVTEYLEGVGTCMPDGRKIPFIAVPTTSGTGSEVTSNAVISRVGSSGFKKSLRHSNYIPNAVVVDPELTLDCPAPVTINCSLDALSQLVESYLSDKASRFTDDIALGALERIRGSLMKVCRGQASIEDRSNMSYGAMISGITLTSAGLGAVHGFASVIGGMFSIPHGVVCGTLMAEANRLTLQRLRDVGESSAALEKYGRLGKLFSRVEGRSREYYQDSFIRYLQAITDELQVPPLSKFGITIDDLAGIAEKSGCKNNPVMLDDEDKQQLLISRLE